MRKVFLFTSLSFGCMMFLKAKDRIIQKRGIFYVRQGHAHLP